MPIKFRCQHCRQFLGISRAQASCVVDCPTCGRSIRVPDLEGRVKPLPKPKMDAQDSELAKALDAVAAIGSPTDDPSRIEEGDQGKSTRQTGSGVAERLSAEPIELEILPAPEPVELAPIAQTPAKQDRGWARTAAPGDEWKQLIADARSEGQNEEPKQQLPQAAKTTGDIQPAVQTAAPTRSNATTLFAMVGIAAMIFGVGFWVGRVTTVNAISTTQVDGSNSNDVDDQDDAADKTDAANLAAAFRGRITYQTEAGERRADKGARVIVLPVDRQGSARLPVAGFQNGAALQDRRIAIASIREMGGDFCITSDDGGFDLKLKSSGQFHVIVLSNSLSREPIDEDPAVEQIVGQYFDRSNQLLGRVKYHAEKVRYSGDGTEPLDHSFQRS
jgi:hypothetical protein